MDNIYFLILTVYVTMIVQYARLIFLFPAVISVLISVCLLQAPDWVDAEDCHRCRVQFGVMTRKVGWALLKLGHLVILWFPVIQLQQCDCVQSTCAEIDLDLCYLLSQHHCRACGQIFCGKCSSKYSTIPKFGIEKEVRVCEPCFELLNK